MKTNQKPNEDQTLVHYIHLLLDFVFHVCVLVCVLIEYRVQILVVCLCTSIQCLGSSGYAQL